MLRPAPDVDFTTLRSETDLSALAALGYSFYPHQQVSLGGMGWPVLDTLAPQDPAEAKPVPSRPTLLLYAPTLPTLPLSVTAPRDGFDFRYQLVGWAYLFPYDFAQHPIVGGDGRPFLTCLEREAWFVHERAVHPFEDGGMRPVPPDEAFHGTAPGRDAPEFSPPDVAHGRAWDVHVWLDGDEVPSVSILNPGDLIPGVDPHVGASPPMPDEPKPWFFYPPQAADLSLAIVDWPDPVGRGERLTYTITVANNGPHPATGVALTGTLPAHTANRSATPSQGSCTVNKTAVSCDLGKITTGASATVTIVVRPTGEGTIVNAASVSAGELDIRRVLDPKSGERWTDATGDNRASESTTVLP